MLTLIKYELFKLFKRKKTWVVIIGFMLLSALMIFGVYRDALNQKRYNSPEYNIQMNEQQLGFLQNRKNYVPEDIKNDETKVQEYQNRIDEEINNIKDQIQEWKDKQSISEDADGWKKTLEKEIKQNEEMLQQPSLNSESKDGDVENTRSHNEQLKYLLANNIKPQNDYDFNALRAIQDLMRNLGQLFLLVGVAVFVADIVSGEATPPTLKLLLTQPISRGKMLLSKFIAISLAAIFSILIVELLAFIVTGIMFGFGNLKYPFVVGTQYHIDNNVIENGTHPLRAILGSSYLIPSWKYTLEFLGLQLLYVISVVSVTFMISSLVKSSMISMGISTVGFIAIMVLMGAVKFFRGLQLYVFLGYTDFQSILTGQISYSLGKANPKIYFVIIVLLAWTFVSYAISHLVFKKKDILI